MSKEFNTNALLKDRISQKTALELLQQAESLFTNDQSSKDFWFDFMNESRKPKFLQALKTQKSRNRWTELVFNLIQKYNYNLSDLIQQRVDEHPDKILFIDRSKPAPTKWTYKQVYHNIKEIAAFIYTLNKEPRVALFLSNDVVGAISDLACLSYDIFNTPLNIHFNSEILEYIFKKLNINIIITDRPNRLKIVTEAVKKANLDIKIVVTKANTSKYKGVDYYLTKESKKISLSKANEILSKRKIKRNNQVATTMFTSGSTGMPKGVSFSIYNIVSKRYARAAALPQVGINEKFVCYLPLFHTFGRYLELTGSIFWSGTYVFTGNASSATLLPLFPKENPTGFISVPIRWVQLYEKCIEEIEDIENESEKKKIIRKVMGKNLHWGLSAAGYLDPKIFRFFHRYGISLNSGFGMTEATGGITMTPSFNYKENTTGIPLPGIQTRLKKNNELEIKSHYLAKYLEDAGPTDLIPYPHEEDYWLATGDIFTIDDSDFHEIIDRVKDIYKNNKGQTVAPGMIEKKFAGVPGIKQTFLVGDGKPYNVLLIVPDNEDPIISSSDQENINEYFHQIIMTANKDLAPYERVINFSILSRDFSEEKDELTPKGSFKRKTIEQNFKDLILSLYKKNFISFKKKDFEIIIPRWFYRDIGVLETDILFKNDILFNKRTNFELRICKTKEKNVFTVGDLNYRFKTNIIDLGLIVRQPKLWIGNPELIHFSPLKNSYDLHLRNMYPQVCLPEKNVRVYNQNEIKQPKGIEDADLILLNGLISGALHTEKEIAIQNLNQIDNIFSQYEKNKVEIIRRRLEALSCHQEEEIRIYAYRILLSKDKEPGAEEILPAFINSGKSFLNEESIKLLAKTPFEYQQLDALRKRMHIYRTELEWPANKQTTKQFENIFELLLNFGLNNPKYYRAIRAEFASWMLHKKYNVLSKKAEKLFYELYVGFSAYIDKKTKSTDLKEWENKIAFDEIIPIEDRKVLIEKLSTDHSLKKAVILIYDDYNFDIAKLKDSSIWVSRIKSYRSTRHYRMSINTKTGKHYDLHISIDKKLKTKRGLETLYRLIAMGGHPYERRTVSSFGCGNPDREILISGYLSMLTAWDKIRALAAVQATGRLEQANAWRKIYIRSLSAYLTAWYNSNKEILPGQISLNNVAFPENDFSDNAVIISLSGWKKIDSSIPLFISLVQNFYYQTSAHYPIAKKFIKIRWIFHSCVEAFGKEKAMEILTNLQNEIKSKPDINYIEKELLDTLESYFKDFKGRIYFPLPLFNAIDRYSDWKNRNSHAGFEAKKHTITELFDLYGLEKHPDIVRYKLYRETFFSDSDKKTKTNFDHLLFKMSEDLTALPIQITELSDLQAGLASETEREIFGKMVFPDLKTKQKVDIMTIGEKKDEHVIVKSILSDKRGIEYTMREPLEAYEVGELYKLFYKENYPKEISKMDKHYIVTDLNEKVIGGLCYKELEKDIVLIDGMAVISPLHGKGIGSAMMEDFFTRMKVFGIKTIKAHFLFGNYYLKHNFVIDKKWGALVREL